MSALTIHLPKQIEEAVRRASAQAGQSVSAWIASAARRRLEEAPPPPQLAALFGAFPELTPPSRDEAWSHTD
jgi:hypothetical protein